MFGNRISLSLWIILYFILLGGIKAQDNEIKLSMKQALELAEKNNLDLKLTKAELEGVRADKNKSLAAFLPKITLSETYIKTDDPLNSFGFKLKQEIVTAMDFNPALLNDPGSIENYNTKAEVMQPLINLDAFFGRAAAADGLSAMKYKLKRTKNYINFMVKVNYNKLILLQESKRVISNALKVAKENKKVIKNYFDQGLITKADYLMAEVWVATLESKLSEIENNFKTANNEFKLMLQIDDEGLIVPTDSLTDEKVKTEFNNLKEYALQRSDILAYEYRAKAMGKMVTMNWMKLLPRLNAFGAFEYNDTKMFGTGAKNYMAGLNLRWDIFNGFQNIASIQKSKAEFNKADIEYKKAKQKSIIEVENALGELKTAENQLKLSMFASKHSDESYRIIKDRYNRGLEKTVDLLNAETKASTSKLKYLKSIFMYKLSAYKLELMTEREIN